MSLNGRGADHRNRRIRQIVSRYLRRIVSFLKQLDVNMPISLPPALLA
jgi:hypothetical protein